MGTATMYASETSAKMPATVAREADRRPPGRGSRASSPAAAATAAAATYAGTSIARATPRGVPRTAIAATRVGPACGAAGPAVADSAMSSMTPRMAIHRPQVRGLRRMVSRKMHSAPPVRPASISDDSGTVASPACQHAAKKYAAALAVWRQAKLTNHDGAWPACMSSRPNRNILVSEAATPTTLKHDVIGSPDVTGLGGVCACTCGVW